MAYNAFLCVIGAVDWGVKEKKARAGGLLANTSIDCRQSLTDWRFTETLGRNCS